MKQNCQFKKIIKLFLIIIIILAYYLLNRDDFEPFSIYLMLPIGFIFAFQIRNKKINYIDIVILSLLSIILMMLMVPPIDFLGVFKQYMIPSSNILSLIIFLFGYHLSYFITKNNDTNQ